MEYTVNKLSKLAGVSTRTLRYYDEINLLKPARIDSNGYRIYSQKEVNLLQQILFYRELDVGLEDIKNIVTYIDFDSLKALEQHREALLLKNKRLNLLIDNVENTIKLVKAGIPMDDEQKFEGFKQSLISENNKKYGKEIITKYGEDAVKKSISKIKGMNKEQYAECELLSIQLNEMLKAAFLQGDPTSELAQKVCELHKKWLCFYWDSYSKEAHIGVTQLYVDDIRFRANYDKIGVGCAEFLRDAVRIFVNY